MELLLTPKSMFEVDTRGKKAVIVNAANPYLSRGAGVCGLIYAAAGPDLEEQTMFHQHLLPLEVGTYVNTPPYELAPKFSQITHAISPDFKLEDCSRGDKKVQLYQLYYNILFHEFASTDVIVIPLLSSGIYALEAANSWGLLSDAFKAWQKTCYTEDKLLIVSYFGKAYEDIDP